MKIHFNYSIKNEILLIACAHNPFTSKATSMVQTRTTLSRSMDELPDNEAGDKQLEDGLKHNFNAIKTDPNYNKVQNIIYSGDVNLNHSNKEEFPPFLINDFINIQFAPIPVYKVLFSANTEIVTKANNVLNQANIVGILKPIVVPTHNSQNAIRKIIETISLKMHTFTHQGDEAGILTEQNEGVFKESSMPSFSQDDLENEEDFLDEIYKKNFKKPSCFYKTALKTITSANEDSANLSTEEEDQGINQSIPTSPGLNFGNRSSKK